MVWHQGSCHCGRVQLEVEAPPDLQVSECNCSMCARLGYRHLIVPAHRFRLRSGADGLTRYRFGTNTAEHLFCSVCGIKTYYVPRSHPDGFSVNVSCLDAGTIASVVTVRRFDGANWEQHAAELPPLEP